MFPHEDEDETIESIWGYKTPTHTPMPGPYDDLACWECTASKRATYSKETLARNEPLYVAYPCPDITKGDSNVTDN
jgi:hypothetical protein